jgi:hypothetical protein
VEYERCVVVVGGGGEEMGWVQEGGKWECLEESDE